VTPYQQIWCLDFEFLADPGARPAPVCLVAREQYTGRTIRLWRDQLLVSGPPFPSDDPDVLFVTFFASAEWSCFLALDWPLPIRILDLYAEFRLLTNGRPPVGGRSLLNMLATFGLEGMARTAKADARALVLRGGPWSPGERAGILDYCERDVVALAELLPRVWPGIVKRGLGPALLRGRYTAAVARMEHAGVPVDAATLERLRRHWSAIKAALVAEVNQDYGVFEGRTFKHDRFAEYLRRPVGPRASCPGPAPPRAGRGRCQRLDRRERRVGRDRGARHRIAEQGRGMITMLIDEDEHATYHLPASGRAGLIRVPRNGGEPVLMRARRGQRLACMVPPRAAAESSLAESVIAYGAAHAEDDRFAPIPKSLWPEPKVLPPWSPPPSPAMNSDDYCPAPSEPDWSRLRPTAPTAKKPADVDDGYAHINSPWDR
jgi:hypothetical protein